ncbi:MAG: hypothetical protein M1401_01800 [Chloroflexi bacterium]|nr:hypothetical protein [Chloroflexota bacterium]
MPPRAATAARVSAAGPSPLTTTSWGGGPPLALAVGELVAAGTAPAVAATAGEAVGGAAFATDDGD